MITKKEFAEYIFKREIKNGDGHVNFSSSYAVAADFLGMLSGPDSEYAKTRGGIFIEHEGKILSVREVLGLLPDTIASQ